MRVRGRRSLNLSVKGKGVRDCDGEGNLRAQKGTSLLRQFQHLLGRENTAFSVESVVIADFNHVGASLCVDIES